MQQAGQLVGQGNFEEAATSYAKIVLAQPDNAQAWQMLGYSLHAQGDLDRAMRVHLKAATFDSTRPIAMYNVACVHAMQGNADAAFASLEESIAAGFNDPNQFGSDSDLNNLHGDPRWARMMDRLSGRTAQAEAVAPAPAPAPVAAPKAKQLDLAKVAPERQFDFWIGDWELYIDGNAVGEWSVQPELDGKVIRQTGPASMTVVVFEPNTQKWHMTWMSNQGHHDVLTGTLQGDKIVMMQPVVREQEGAIGRWTMHDITANSFATDWELSMDGGKTWNMESAITHKRVGASAPKAASASATTVSAALVGAYDFTLGQFDMEFKAMMPDQSWVQGKGELKAKRNNKGEIIESISMTMEDGTTWEGTTKRELNTRDGNWALMWNGADGQQTPATGKQRKDGSIVEFSSGSDEHGEYQDTMHYLDITKKGFTIRLDRKYESMDAKIEGLFVATVKRR